MEDSIFRFTLDVHKTQSQVSISASQYNTKRRLIIRLSDRGIPYQIGNGCFAIFSATKPDGNPLYNDCKIKGNTIIYDVFYLCKDCNVTPSYKLEFIYYP